MSENENKRSSRGGSSPIQDILRTLTKETKVTGGYDGNKKGLFLSKKPQDRSGMNDRS
jgi:hypothetical protein